jgi:hypothetical protein
MKNQQVLECSSDSQETKAAIRRGSHRDDKQNPGISARIKRSLSDLASAGMPDGHVGALATEGLERATSERGKLSPDMQTRPKWEIDLVLERLVGEEIRVAARAFTPVRKPGEKPLALSPVRTLFLPDNSRPAGLPVFLRGDYKLLNVTSGSWSCASSLCTPQTRRPRGRFCSGAEQP